MLYVLTLLIREIPFHSIHWNKFQYVGFEISILLLSFFLNTNIVCEENW